MEQSKKETAGPTREELQNADYLETSRGLNFSPQHAKLNPEPETIRPAQVDPTLVQEIVITKK